ncbi:unnamed protein product [Amaranthus hypochondriacus]
MYNNVAAQPGGQQPPFPPQASPFGNAFSRASSGLIRSGLSAYGEKIFGSSSEYVQSNISRYFADPQYYFQVNDDCEEQVDGISFLRCACRICPWAEWKATSFSH